MPDNLNINSLFTEHGAFLGRVVERISGKGPHVDDLLQEAFIIAYKKQHRFDASRAAPRTWLYGIVVQLCRTHERGRRRYRHFYNRFSRESEEAPLRPDELMDKQKEATMVHQAIQTIPFKQRQVFVLYELEEMDGKQISEMLNIPEGTVWTRLLHGRKHFKKQVARLTGPGGIR